jgi:biotin operon repressor
VQENNVMHHLTNLQSGHSATILDLLHAAKPGWVSGKVLAGESGTTMLSGRISGLRAEGWDIRSRATGGDGFHEYRLVGKGHGGRKLVSARLPTLPDRAWTEEEVAEYTEAAQSAVDFLYAIKHKPVEAPKLDWYDQLLADGILIADGL